jgi:hypothetical protein
LVDDAAHLSQRGPICSIIVSICTVTICIVSIICSIVVTIVGIVGIVVISIVIGVIGSLHAEPNRGDKSVGTIFVAFLFQNVEKAIAAVQAGGGIAPAAATVAGGADGCVGKSPRGTRAEAISVENEVGIGAGDASRA